MMQLLGAVEEAGKFVRSCQTSATACCSWSVAETLAILPDAVDEAKYGNTSL
jgi:hypothetical protein